MDCNNRPIGIFDSGVGGLTVMREIMRMLPNEDLIYFGDTARVPYGEKSPATIIRYCLENAIFLMEKNIKVLVVACNTASAYALDKLQQILSIPVIGVIDAGSKKAIEVSVSKRIAVLGTRGTIGSNCYQEKIQLLDPSAYVLGVACPLLVPLIEEQLMHHPATQLLVKEYVNNLRQQNIDTLLLGCTHYPLLSHLIADVLGEQMQIVDSATTCAQMVAELINNKNLTRTSSCVVSHRYFVSDDPKRFTALGSAFLGLNIEHVEAVSTQLV